jgi:acetate kinase
VISADDSRVTVLVVPTNEELEISRQSLQAVRDSTGG